MLGAIAIFLISTAAGYLVLAKASDKSGWIKLLGFVLGLLIIGVSLAGVVLVPIQAKNASQMGGGMGRIPMPGQGQFRMPEGGPSGSAGQFRMPDGGMPQFRSPSPSGPGSAPPQEPPPGWRERMKEMGIPQQDLPDKPPVSQPDNASTGKQ